MTNKFLNDTGLTTLWTKVDDKFVRKDAFNTALNGKSDVGHTHDYLPLSGGTLTGDITTKSLWTGTDDDGLFIEGKSTIGIRIQYNKNTTGNNYDQLVLKNGVISWNNKTLLHEGNYSSYVLPLSGGTITGNLSLNKYLRINAWEGYGSGSANIWYDGTLKQLKFGDVTDMMLQNGEIVIHSGNIGSQNISSADKISHSTYYYSDNVMKNNTSAYVIFGENARANFCFPAFMEGQSSWSGYADVLNFTGYCKWGGTQIASQYNSLNPRVAIRKFVQDSSINGGGTWGNWNEFVMFNNVKTTTSVSHSEWSSEDRGTRKIATLNFLSYWNGAHNDEGDSNLQYSTNGEIIGTNNISDQAVYRSKYLESLSENSTAWYGDSYKFYTQWNGSILDLKCDGYETRADRAKKLNNARSIFGQSFDGTADISANSVGCMRYLLFRNIDNNDNVGYIGRGSSSDNAMELINYTENNLDLGTNGSVKFRITGTGKIMLGSNSNPSYKVDIKNTIDEDYDFHVYNNSTKSSFFIGKEGLWYGTSKNDGTTIFSINKNCTYDGGGGNDIFKVNTSGIVTSYGITLFDTAKNHCGLMPNSYISSGGDSKDIWLYNDNKVSIYGGTGVSIGSESNSNIVIAGLDSPAFMGRLYSESPYQFGGSNPYYARLRWNTNSDSKWYLSVYPENPKQIAVDYAYSAGSAPASDVYAWAKAASKPTYTASEVGAAASSHTHTSFSNNLTVSGTITATGFYEASDERLKEFEDDIDIDLNILKKIPKKYFKFKEDPTTTHIGTSAQVIKELYPELVTENEEGYLSVDYAKLSVIALSAVDELYKETQKIPDIEDRLLQLEQLIKSK